MGIKIQALNIKTNKKNTEKILAKLPLSQTNSESCLLRKDGSHSLTELKCIHLFEKTKSSTIIFFNLTSHVFLIVAKENENTGTDEVIP